MKLTNEDFKSLAANRVRKEFDSKYNRLLWWVFYPALVLVAIGMTVPSAWVFLVIGCFMMVIYMAFFISGVAKFKKKCVSSAQDLKILVMGEGVTVE
jgi:hypothetical protein